MVQLVEDSAALCYDKNLVFEQIGKKKNGSQRKEEQENQIGELRERERDRERQRERETDRQRERQTDRDRQTDRQTDRQRDRDRDRQTDR